MLNSCLTQDSVHGKQPLKTASHTSTIHAAISNTHVTTILCRYNASNKIITVILLYAPYVKIHATVNSE